MIDMKSIITLSRFAGCDGGIFANEYTEVNNIFIDSYSSKPFTKMREKPNACNAGLVSRINTSVSVVLKAAYFPKIVYLIIRSIVINMVNFFWHVSVNIKPCEPMKAMLCVIYAYLKVSVAYSTALSKRIFCIPRLKRLVCFKVMLRSFFPYKQPSGFVV